MEQQENSRFEKIYKGLYSLAESYVLIDKDLYKNIDKLNSDYFTNYHEKKYRPICDDKYKKKQLVGRYLSRMLDTLTEKELKEYSKIALETYHKIVRTYAQKITIFRGMPLSEQNKTLALISLNNYIQANLDKRKEREPEK